MQTPDFDAYLNAVTDGILSKKAKESVKAELADHLFIKYELLCAQGKSEEEANDGEKMDGRDGARGAVRGERMCA